MPEVQNGGGSRATLPPKAVGKGLFQAILPASGGGQMASGCVTVVPASVNTWCSALHVCLCPDFPLLTRTPVLASGPIRIQYDLVLT